jgi:3-deoxy-D-manno-octulosonic-acid transferase
MRWLYSLATYALQPLLRYKLARRARAEPGYAVGVEERFGYYDASTGVPLTHASHVGQASHVDQRLVWVHAVSLGETRAAAVLVEQLRMQWPGMRLLLTNGTATGRAQGLALLQPGDVQVWQPWDTPAAVNRFLLHFRPTLGVVMETEVWPNLVAACTRLKVPLCLVNARLSAQSLRKALRFAWLSLPAYSGLRAVWAQSADDAARLTQLGAPVRGVMGNFKFDATPDATQLAQGRVMRRSSTRPVVMFASSREGEEQLLLQEFKKIMPVAPVDIAQEAINIIAIKGTKDLQAGSDVDAPAGKVQWLIVPRHPQRFAEVAQLLISNGLSVSRRSSWGAEPEPADVWLGDSLGEMALYFGLADVALLGGSFAPLGGQNLIEAAACGCPVVMGPHTFNFAEAAALSAQAGAAIAVADMPQAVGAALALVHAPQALEQARQAAQSLGQMHRGAAQRTALALQQL